MGFERLAKYKIPIVPSNKCIYLDITRLTASEAYELRVDMVDWSDKVATAHYDDFKIVKEVDDYKLKISGYRTIPGLRVRSSRLSKMRRCNLHSLNCRALATLSNTMMTSSLRHPTVVMEFRITVSTAGEKEPDGALEIIAGKTRLKQPDLII